MKKVYSLVFVFLFVVCAFFTSCAGGYSLSDNPKKDALVVGNGGVTAIKDGYLYFVNGYEDSTKLKDYKKDNVEGEVERAGIYRTKLNKNGNVDRDENGFLKNCDLVVSKVVGFNNGSFYIYGDQIYFLTPHNEKNKDGDPMNSWLDVCRMNINGSGKLERLYYTENDATNFKWSVYNIDKTPYVVLLDGKKIISINGNTKKELVLTEDATSVAFEENSTFDFNVSNSKYIYYTRDKKDSDNVSISFTGNIVCKVNITDLNDKKNETYINTLNDDLYSSYKIVKLENNNVYYSKTDSRMSSITLLYKKDVSNLSFVNASEIELTIGNYPTYIILDENKVNPNKTTIIGLDANKQINVVVKNDLNNKDSESRALYVGSEDTTLIDVQNNKLFFKESDTVKMIDLIDPDAKPVNILNSNKKYKLDAIKLINIIDEKVFVMAEYKPENSEAVNYYMNIITTTIKDEKAQFLGKFADQETPKDPNVDLKKDEEPIKPWV